MLVFLTGAIGWISSAIARDLMAAGHHVVGLVQSEDKGAKLASAGGTPLIGSLRDVDVLHRGAAGADGVVHTAFGPDIPRIGELAAEERTAIDTFGMVFARSKRLIVVTYGLLHPTGERAVEADRPAVMPAFPRVSQQDGLRAGGARPTRLRRAATQRVDRDSDDAALHFRRRSDIESVARSMIFAEIYSL